MALSAATQRKSQLGDDQLIIPVAGSTTIYPGGAVCSNSSGYAVPAADTAGFETEGVALHETDSHGNRVRGDDNVIDNSAGSDGDKYVLVDRSPRRWRFDTHETVDQSVMHAQAYWYDDDTVSFDTDNISNNIEAGVVTRYVDSGTVEVLLKPAIESTGRSFTIPTPTPTPTA